MAAEKRTKELWRYIESRRESIRIVDRIYNWLNQDKLDNLIVDPISGFFWLELTDWAGGTPKYVLNWFKKHMKKQGFTHIDETLVY